MREMVKRKVTYDREYCTKMVCDICGKESAGDDWTTENYQIANTTISMEEGCCYPDSGDKKVTSYDICLVCFKLKVMPYLAEFGADGVCVEEHY